jgi:tetratricopeptide (TPR) repeat protein
VIHGKSFPRLAAAGLLAAFAVSAQTLQQAEALHKAHRDQDSNEMFRQLVEKEPKNPDYRVRWGMLFYDTHAQEDDAAKLFREALEIKQDHAGALLGLALLAEDEYDHRAADYANRALKADPKLVAAQEVLARLALEDNNNPKAIEEAKKALAIDPNADQAKAVLATIDWLANKKDSSWDPHSASGYETAGHFFTMNRRYEEGIALLRKSLDLDPQRYTARADLGINLMRLGQDQEARQQLETCFNNGFASHAVKNTLKLMDTYKNYVTFKTDHTILRIDKREAELLHPYFESEMLRAVATYSKKYKLDLGAPVQVEVYPNHEDFAIRTMGMPGMGAILGVTFGYSVAMDSPSGRKPGSFHWASTMWHELSHVYTLTLTHHRVPRWFTEGLAVHEETAVSPEWGDRLGPDEVAAIKDKQLLPIADLDRGFIHPVRPQQVVVSYFQAGKICDYITDTWGWDTILAMLKDFGDGDETAAVVRKELKIEPEEFDKRFLAHLETETKSVVDHIEQWKKQIKIIYELSQKKDWDAVIKEATAIRDYYPDYVEEHSVYEILAKAYLAKDEKPAALAELRRYIKIGGRDPDLILQTSKLLEEQNDKKEAAAVLDRLNFIWPLLNQAHQKLGELWLAQGNTSGAVREFHSVVSHSPIDPAEAHYQLARAYHLNKEDEKAKDELLAALETAPGYRQAQKLLLELSDDQPNTVKK